MVQYTQFNPELTTSSQDYYNLSDLYYQVALYCRQELNLRSPTNLLLAFASLYKPCRPYLPRYFASCINIPSDWIAVADYVTTFEISDANVCLSTRKECCIREENINGNDVQPNGNIGKCENHISLPQAMSYNKGLPAILRKVMAAKFSDFDEYQLAKYNKRSRLKNPSKIKVSVYIWE